VTEESQGSLHDELMDVDDNLYRINLEIRFKQNNGDIDDAEL
jgi:hypothetical protein